MHSAPHYGSCTRANHGRPPPPLALAVGPRQATLRQPGWTMPEINRLRMHAFSRPSEKLEHKVRAVTLRSIHHTFLYMRLILQARDTSSSPMADTGTSIHKRLGQTPTDGDSLLKFLYGQLYNCKLTHRYGHAPTDECPCGISPTLVSTSRESAKLAKTSPLAATMRLDSWSVRQSATSQKKKGRFIEHRILYLWQHTPASNHIPRTHT